MPDELPADVLTTAAEHIAAELRKNPWINASPDRIRAVAYDAAERALKATAPLLVAAERERCHASRDRILQALAHATTDPGITPETGRRVRRVFGEALADLLREAGNG